MGKRAKVQDRALAVAIVRVLKASGVPMVNSEVTEAVTSQLGEEFFGEKQPAKVVGQVLVYLRDDEGVLVGGPYDGFELVEPETNLAEMIETGLYARNRLGGTVLAGLVEVLIRKLDMPYDLACELLDFTPGGMTETLVTMQNQGMVLREKDCWFLIPENKRVLPEEERALSS